MEITGEGGVGRREDPQVALNADSAVTIAMATVAITTTVAVAAAVTGFVPVGTMISKATVGVEHCFLDRGRAGAQPL